VYLVLSQAMSHPQSQVDQKALLHAKEETIRVLEEQLRLRAEEIQRRDVIISRLTQANAALVQRARAARCRESQGVPPGSS
jgi:hypothetical protein